MSANEALPAPPHLASEFCLWLWWTTDTRGHTFDLGDEVGTVDVWVDDRIAFRGMLDKASAVLTGEDAATTPEARAALRAGKVLQDVRVGFRRDDREHLFTLKGPTLEITAAKLPQVVKDGVAESLHERMFLYEEIVLVVRALYRMFAEVRVSDAWGAEVLPAVAAWAAEA
jgi:hypothetical protein